MNFPKQIPHKLHLVTLIRSGIRRPWWEKRCIKRLGLTKLQTSVVLKNTPQVNRELELIKTLIKVQPVVISETDHNEQSLKTHKSLLSDGETEVDLSELKLISGTFVNEKGEFNMNEYLKYVEKFPNEELQNVISKSHYRGSELMNRDFYLEEEAKITDKGDQIGLYFKKKTWHQPGRLATRLKNKTKY